MRLVLLLAFFIGFSPLFAQDDESEKKFCNEIDSKTALKLYEKGTDKKKYPKPERLQFLKKCLEEVPDFAEANMAMGQEIIVHCKLENSPFTPACRFFQAAIASCPQIHSEAYYYIGFDYYERAKYDSATKYLEKFIKFKDDNEKKYGKEYEGELYQAKEMLKSIKKENSLKRGVPFSPKVVNGVSTERDEYLAYISPDDRNCFFVRKVPINNKNVVYSTDKEKEVFMKSMRDKTGVFDKGEEMPWPFNESNDNQGGCTISLNNKHLYFAMMRFEGGPQGNCDLYVSENVDDEWKPFQKLGGTAVNDPKYWDSQPTVSANDNYMIFASDRPGGYGGIDLYMTRRDSITKEWGKPQNLGPKINTKGNEKTPFIHSDSKTLYFSSNYHYGFGGYDIFYARKNDKGEWEEPVNIGSPINGESDDVGLFVSANAQTGYFFSFDEGKVAGKGVGRYDLYSFPLYQEARPDEVQLMTVAQKDFDGDKVRDGEIDIRNAQTNKQIDHVVDKRTGVAVAAINVKEVKDILITAKKEGRAFQSKIVSVKDLVTTSPAIAATTATKANTNTNTTSTKTNTATAEEPEPDNKVELKMEEIEVGKSFLINNIYYNTSSTHLFEESKTVLKNFAEYLKENPKMKIEIQGHTDNVGKPADNQALSENRAFSVKELLESYGVEPGRITEKGFGSSKPIADNSTELGRAKNRRTEFKILEN